MRRTQIYLDDRQHGDLAALAKQRGVTSSALIREAIDRYIAGQLSPQEKLAELRALGAKFAARSASADDSATTVDNLRSGDARRLESLA